MTSSRRRKWLHSHYEKIKSVCSKGKEAYIYQFPSKHIIIQYPFTILLSIQSNPHDNFSIHITSITHLPSCHNHSIMIKANFFQQLNSLSHNQPKYHFKKTKPYQLSSSPHSVRMLGKKIYQTVLPMLYAQRLIRTYNLISLSKRAYQ